MSGVPCLSLFIRHLRYHLCYIRPTFIHLYFSLRSICQLSGLRLRFYFNGYDYILVRVFISHYYRFMLRLKTEATLLFATLSL